MKRRRILPRRHSRGGAVPFIVASFFLVELVAIAAAAVGSSAEMMVMTMTIGNTSALLLPLTSRPPSSFSRRPILCFVGRLVAGPGSKRNANAANDWRNNFVGVRGKCSGGGGPAAFAATPSTSVQSKGWSAHPPTSSPFLPSSSFAPPLLQLLGAATNNAPVGIPSAVSYSSGATAPDGAADNFSRYSKFLVKNSNGVDGLSGKGGASTRGGSEGMEEESIVWVDNLGRDKILEHHRNGPSGAHPRPFSVLSWNVLAQSLYESQYQRRRIQQVALSSPSAQHEAQLLSHHPSPHPHPWPMRLKRIIEILSRANADVICLQECELRSFEDDLVPALSKLGYDGVAQEDDRPENERPMKIKEATKHRTPRNHIVATFWKRDAFEPAGGEASVRTRSLTTVLRLKSSSHDDVDDGAVDDSRGEGEKAAEAPTPMPTVAVVNVHLEGHPRRFSERTHQLQHAMNDLARRIERERGEDEGDDGPSASSSVASSSDASSSPATDGSSGGTGTGGRIGRLNALVIAGDFNCELQSSACSTYLRMGRLGRQAGLGGVHGEDSTVLPPSLLETTEATEVIHPIMEWGRALPEDRVADVDPHPFRRNGMASAYPARLGEGDAREHFTFCSELSKRPVPGLDQMWFSTTTLERTALRNMFVIDDGPVPSWERYFYDDDEVRNWRDHERERVLMEGLPSADCRHPSDHLPIGAAFDWKQDDGCGDDDPCLLEDGDDDDDVQCAAEDACEVRGLNVVGSGGNNVQDEKLQDQLLREGLEKKSRERKETLSFENPQDELDHLLRNCPYDSDEQESVVRYILGPVNPPIDPIAKDRPSPGQLEQLEARRAKKAELLTTASLGVRPWLKDIWKVSKQAGKQERRRLIEEARRAEKGE